MNVTIDKLQQPTYFNSIEKALKITEQNNKMDPDWNYKMKWLHSGAKNLCVIEVYDENNQYVGTL